MTPRLDDAFVASFEVLRLAMLQCGVVLAMVILLLLLFFERSRIMMQEILLWQKSRMLQLQGPRAGERGRFASSLYLLDYSVLLPAKYCLRLDKCMKYGR